MWTVREATEADLESWSALRSALWPEHVTDAALTEERALLRSPDQVCFLLVDEHGAQAGFLEGALHAAPEGSYGHVEGWYVAPEARGRGHGQRLMGAFEQWCLHRAIRRLTSDTSPEYPASPAAHARAGFRPVARLTIFVKDLGDAARGDGRDAR